MARRGPDGHGGSPRKSCRGRGAGTCTVADAAGRRRILAPGPRKGRRESPLQLDLVRTPRAAGERRVPAVIAPRPSPRCLRGGRRRRTSRSSSPSGKPACPRSGARARCCRPWRRDGARASAPRQSSVASTFTIRASAPAAARGSDRAARGSTRSSSAPHPAGSACRRSPSAMAPSRASPIACESTSASLCPSRPQSVWKRTPPSTSMRPWARRWMS